jgi:hypothetical protein
MPLSIRRLYGEFLGCRSVRCPATFMIAGTATGSSPTWPRQWTAATRKERTSPPSNEIKYPATAFTTKFDEIHVNTHGSLGHSVGLRARDLGHDALGFVGLGFADYRKSREVLSIAA